MDFTYKEYIALINKFRENGYIISNYDDYKINEKSIIIRHDVDETLNKAVELSSVEKENQIKSTYFILLSTNFYNFFSKESLLAINKIIDDGNDIGLHFDETKYNCKNVSDIIDNINYEKDIMEKCLDIKIKSVSMHRPSKLVLENDIEIPNLINTYSKEFFNDIKYLSDSRMHWMENPYEIANNDTDYKVQLLTHPMLYSDINLNIKQVFKNFFDDRKYMLYSDFKNNMRDFEEILKYEEC